MLDRPLAPNSHHYCKVLFVSPVAAPYSATVNFRVEGFNLVSSSSRYFIIYNLHMFILAEDEYSLMFISANMLLSKNTCHVHRLICSIEGRCIFEEDTAIMADDAEDEDIEYLNFCCSLPDTRGRGFIEVQVYNLLTIVLMYFCLIVTLKSF